MAVDFLIPELSLETALLISLLSACVLVGLFKFLNRYTHRDYFTIWTAGWLFYALFLAISLLVDPARPAAGLVMSQNWCVGTAAIMMFWGSFKFVTFKPGQNIILVMLGVVTLWSCAAAYEFPGELWIQVPGFALLSLASFFTAFTFFLHRGRTRFVAGGLLSLGFTGWGFYLASYPFLASTPELLSAGFLTSGVLQLFIGVSMIILVLEEVKADMRQAEEKYLQQKDVADQFQGEAARHQESYRQLFENASEAIIIVSATDLSILDLNEAARTLLRIPGWLRGSPITRYCAWNPADQANPAKWLEGICEAFECGLTREDGSVVRAQVRGGPIPFSGLAAFQLFFTEMTRRAKLEQQLRQAEKLSALGQMISGVAHELNNPLAVIKGYTDLMLLSHNLDQETRATLIKVAQEGNRAARLVHNFLSFAQPEAPEHSHLEFNALVQRSLNLRSGDLQAARTELILNLAPDDLPVLGDASQLSQVISHIINNAMQAMAGQSTRPTLIISTRSHDEKIQLRIEDSGPGVPDDVLPHIFDPFYSTRPAGAGAGLGLSICYSIVLHHKGRLYYEPRVPAGACFTVELPLAQESAPGAANRLQPSLRPTTAEPAPNNRRIMVVDDEAGIADLLKEMLRLLGYDAVSFNNPEQALAALAEEPCDAVISDFRMPGMNGGQLYQSTIRQHPYLAGRFIFVTGDIINEETKSFFQTTGLPYILKPFQLASVEAAVENALKKPEPGNTPAGTVLTA